MLEIASLEPFDTSQQEPSEPVHAREAPQNQLPPEAQGDANGGPLGCCFGVIIALLLSLSIAIISRLYSVQLAGLLHGWLSFTVKAAMIGFIIVASIALGYAGWKIGRKVFREYEPSPRQQKRMERLQQRQVGHPHRRH